MKVDSLLVSILAAVHVHVLDATAAQGTFCWKEGSLQYFDSPAFVLLASIVISLDWWSHRMRVRQDQNNMQKTCLEWKVASVVASMLVAATAHVLDDTVAHGTLH